MKLEDQVCSLELAKKLKKLGVKQESLFSWLHIKKTKKWRLVASSEELQVRSFYVGKELVSAFTVAELGEILPKGYMSFHNSLGKWFCEDLDTFIEPDYRANDYDTEASARAKMVIYLKEKGLIK